MPITIGNDADKGSYNPPRFCNCKRSNCLKLYCECFGYGVLCAPGSCNCYSCQNNADNEQLRNSTMESILERNPNAFRPKADVLKRADSVQVVHKGCFCKKSNCLKKYCECFQAEIVCCELCRCSECKNFEGSAALKKLVGDASAANVNSAVPNPNPSWGSAMLGKYSTAAPTQAMSSSSGVSTRLAPTPVPPLGTKRVACDDDIDTVTTDEVTIPGGDGSGNTGTTGSKRRRGTGDPLASLSVADQLQGVDAFAEYVATVVSSANANAQTSTGTES